MRYDHPLWDVMMQLFEYSEKKLEEAGKGTMLADTRQLHQSVVKEFTLHRDQIARFLQYFSSEDCLNPLPGLDRLNDAETEAVQGGDIKAVSTAEGRRAVKEASKRLEEREKMRPVTEAQEKLKQAEELRSEKERIAKQVQEERARPGRELKEAQKVEQSAEAAVTAAEEAVKKGKP